MNGESIPTVRIRILGPLLIDADPGPVDLGGLRQARLLAILLCANGLPVSYERIVDLMWGQPPLTAQQQIYNAVSILRSRLTAVEGVELSTSRLGYAIKVPPMSADIDVFRAHVTQAERLVLEQDISGAVTRFQTALEVWRGPALSGLTGHNRRFQGIADKLDEERLAVAERYADVQLRLGVTPDLIGELTGLVNQYPHRESLRGSLMVGLMHAGRQAEALATYDSGRRILADELGMDPGWRLQGLYKQILRRELAVPISGSFAAGGR